MNELQLLTSIMPQCNPLIHNNSLYTESKTTRTKQMAFSLLVRKEKTNYYY